MDEEANAGALMPDLSGPVEAVKGAVLNLVTVSALCHRVVITDPTGLSDIYFFTSTQIGEKTVETSTDEKLKEEMPQAFEVTKTASQQLTEAASTLKDNPASAPGRKLMVSGARGMVARKTLK